LQSFLKILFIDDHPGLRDGLAYLLSQKNPDFKFITARTGEEALQKLSEDEEIQTVILDLNLDGTNGLSLLPKLRENRPSIKVLVYTMYSDPLHIEAAIKADIQGYVTKDIDIEEFEKAIESISKGNNYYNKAASSVIHSLLFKGNRNSAEIEDKASLCFQNYKTLTKKEQETFLFLAQKMETFEIAEKLGKSEKTVINQRAIIYQKMNLKDRLELVEAAKLLGVIL